MDTLFATLAASLGEQYQLEHELPRGGMARVFVAFDTRLNRRVALKVFAPSGSHGNSTDRFLREVKTVAALQHPNIVSILSSGEVEGRPYFVMPFLDGESLRARIDRDGAMDSKTVLPILRDVVRALAFAHERGVVHRDIKPDNIFLSGGAAVVLDFGIARAATAAAVVDGARDASLTQTGTSIGTPAYMAPEQIAADPSLDGRADLYSLGLVAYEMLSGRHPFDRYTPQQVLVAQLAERPQPLTSNDRRNIGPLAAVVERCLEKDREQRWHSASDLQRELDGLGSGVLSVDATRIARAQRGRPRWAAISVVVAAVAVASVALVFRDVSRSTVASGARTSATLPALLVLPFSFSGVDSSMGFLSDALTSELIAAATKIPGLRVASAAVSSATLARFPDDSALAAASRVTLLLRGRVLQRGVLVNVVATLIDPVNRSTLWAETIRGSSTNYLELGDSLARAAGIALTHAIGSNARMATPLDVHAGTANKVAFELYLRASAQFQRRGGERLQDASTLLNQAIALDPSFAKAHALLAQVLAVLPLYVAGSSDSLYVAGLESANRAISLDNALGIAYAGRANLLSATYRWRDAERDYRRALALQPDDAQVHAWFGEQLLVRGQVAAAARELARAAELNLLSPIAQASYGLAQQFAGDHGSAMRAVERAHALDSTLFIAPMMQGAVELFAGKASDAVSSLMAAERRAPGLPAILGLLGAAHAAAGDQPAAREIVRRLSASTDADARVALARTLLALKQPAEALDALEFALARRAPLLASESMCEPLFDMVRTNPRFRSIVSAMSLDSAMLQPACGIRR